MRFSSFASAALLLGIGAAHPVSHSLLRRQENIDVTILQFALTLEHLENVFYKSALKLFKEEDFKKAGFGKHFFENLQFVVADEQSHVQLLTGAIEGAGQAPVAPCTYNFPFSDVNSFVTLSSVLEGVGTSAYLGAAALVTDKTILTTAASILVTEALHTSQQRGELYQVPAANPLGTPVSANGIFTLAASFIVECPASNVALPFTAFPSLTVDISGCPDQNGGKWNKWSGDKHRRTDHEDNYNDEKKEDEKKEEEDKKKEEEDKKKEEEDKKEEEKKKEDEKKDDEKDKEYDYEKEEYDEHKYEEYDDEKDKEYYYEKDYKYDYKNDKYYGEKKQEDYDHYDNYYDEYNGWKKGLVCPAPKVGEGAKFHSAVEIPQGSFLTFVSGLSTISVQGNVAGTVIEAAVPETISGQSYVFITKSAISGTILDGDVIAGPAVLEVTPSPPVIDDTTF